jgi:flagellar biosynthetic protein FlhB
MAESKESFQEKTEEPTPRRIRETRKEGNVAKSMEINSALILLTGLITLTIWGGVMFSRMVAVDKFLFSQAGQIELKPDLMQGYIFSGIKVMIGILIPVMIPIVIIGIAANVLQFGFLLAPKAIKPKLSKLNPTEGIKKLISKRSLVELVKNILKIVLIGWIGYVVIAGMAEDMIPLMDQNPWAIFLWVCRGTIKVGFYTVAALVILALFDLMYQRWEHHQQLKMTKQEVKDEAKQTEGDPKVKAKIRQIQFKTAMRRMMKDVATADVVITNPTEIAVALKYEQETMSAPVVVAKGKRLIAQKIRQIALDHDIPIMEEPPLARALYKSTDVGQEIPGNLYQAVAEILAYIYRLREENEHIYS